MTDAVLAIRSRALGDIVLLSPALRALRRGYPNAELHVVTQRHYVPLVEGLEGVDRVWPLDRTHLATLRLAKELRRIPYRVAVDFFGNPRTAFLTRASGAARRAGFDGKRRGAYGIVVPREVRPAPGRREYAAATNVRLAVAAGGVEDGLDGRLSLKAGALARAPQLLEQAGIRLPSETIGLVAAGTWGTKTWPVSHAAGLATRLLDAGREVLLLEGPGEAHVTRTIAAFAPGVRVLPPCDVAELAAVVSRLGALVGTDSGPRHLAGAFGVPTYTWFGPTHPESWTGPGPHAYWQTPLPCRACNRTVCPHWNCMPSLAAEDAAQRVLDHLSRVHGTTADLRTPARA